jgi:hypothetical protein
MVLLAALTATSAAGLSSTLTSPGTHAQDATAGDSNNLHQRVFARLLCGGGWETVMVLLNIGPSSLTFRQFFLSNDGSLVTRTLAQNDGTTLTASAIQGTLNPNASVSLVLPDIGTVQEAWSLLNYDGSQGTVEGYAIVRHRALSGDVSFEATIPLSSMQEFSAYLPFDNTLRFQTQLTLVNPVADRATLVRLSYLDPQGKVLLIDTVSLAAAQQMTIVLPDTYPDLANKVGTISVEADVNRLAAAGLRYNALYGAVATVPVMSRTATGALE